MEDDAGIHDEDLDHLSPLDAPGDLPQEDEESHEEENEELGGDWGSSFPTVASYRPKLTEILKNLHSPEVKIYSEASKEFIDLLRGVSGCEILREYVELSPKCLELAEAWRLHQGKPGMTHILSLVSVILEHPDGKSPSGGISRSLDSFARLLIESKLNDIYTELNSQELRRQSAALFLLASIVKRGMGLASEVAKIFDFKLPVLSKLSGVQKKGGKEVRHGKNRSTRQAFVGFALSFLEVGNPRLLRWIIQQREMYSGVLRWLGSDDTETVVYILSTLRDKILSEHSLIPPGLRSVLFGSVTLEQLSYISGNSMAGPGADIAYEVLVLVCTDPSNGLMPGLNLKGNEKRLLALMKKLKATEVDYHRELLLAIVKKRPSLCSAYMDDFPYNLEPRPSSLWFAAVSLAADMISSINADTAIMGVASHSNDLLAVNDNELQSILKCIIPRACTRSVINKGLLHSDILVQHGTLRLILESLKSLQNLIKAIEDMVESMHVRKIIDGSREVITNLHGLPGFSCFELNGCLGDENFSHMDEPGVERHSKTSGRNLKRSADLPVVGVKKLKSDTPGESIDIVIGGIDAEPTNDTLDEQKEDNKQNMDVEKDHTAIIAELWGLNHQAKIPDEPGHAEIFFHSKLLDVLKFYLCTMPVAFEGSFDFFKILPINPLTLSTDQQQSLLSLLVEFVGQSPGSSGSARTPDLMYKHLQPLINVLIYSQDKRVKGKAYVLARAAMISTGAFDQNFSEIDAWLFFLPGYNIRKYFVETQGAEMFHDFSAVVISFLCDSVSTVGNNLYKYLDHMQKLISRLDDSKDDSPGFSPLVVCILQKCLRLLESDSGTFRLYERSMIALYVCNTLSLLLQSQVDMKTLPGLINLVLTEKFTDHISVANDSESSLCEWRPIKNLLCFARSILHQQSCSFFSISESAPEGHGNSFFLVLAKIKEFLHRGNAGSLAGMAVAFSSSILCASPGDILKNFPLLLTMAQQHFRSHIPFLSLVLFSEQKFLAKVSNLWPDMFICGLEMIEGSDRNNCRVDNGHLIHSNESVSSVSQNHLDSRESAASAFCLFLRHAPFYTLFSAFLSFESWKKHSTRMLDLFRAKIAEGLIDDLITYLRYALFWSYQILSSYKAKPSDILEELFMICFTLVDYIFDRIVVLASDPAKFQTEGTSCTTQYVQDLVDLIFHHPVVSLSVSHPLCCSQEHADESLGDSEEAFLNSLKQNFHPMNNLMLQFLIKVFEFLLALEYQNSYASEVHGPFTESVLEVPKLLVQKVVLLFRENFDLCVEKRDLEPLIPCYNIFDAFMHFVSPFELLELVFWMFSKLENEDSGCTSVFTSAVILCLHIANGTLNMLYNLLQQPKLKSESYLFWEMKIKSFNTAILQRVFYKILDFSISFNLESADICLFSVVDAVYSLRVAKPQPALLPLYMLLSRMIINSPVKLLLHCLYPTSKIKAKTLFRLIEVSPMHMRLFGQIFLGILAKHLTVLDALNVDGASASWGKVTDMNCDYILSEDDFVLLLPSALSYLMSSLCNNRKQDIKLFGSIPTFYFKILMDGFSNWNSYVSRSNFQEEYDEFSLTSMEDFHNLFNNSLLGKAATMLHYFFIINGNSIGKKQRLKIFDDIYSHSSDLLDCDFKAFNTFSYKESLKLINEISAKMALTRLLLFPPESLMQVSGIEIEGLDKMTVEWESERMNSAKLRFMSILVKTLDWIVRGFPQNMEGTLTSCSADSCRVFRFLEHSILRNIIQLSIKIKTYLIQLPSIPFLKLFIRSCLLNRFEDPVTLKAIRCILASLSEGSFSSTEILDLLLGHSQFVLTILCGDATSDSSSFAPSGTLLQPVPSILKSVDVICIDQITQKGGVICDMLSKLKNENCSLEKRRLELIKLLRVLYHFRNRENNTGLVKDDRMDSKELIFLLLSAYGATLSETDLEILHLMHQIESIEGSEYDTIAEMDYLWGSSALKFKKELTVDKLASCSTEERHRMLFRENIPVDTKLCMKTVLHFCYNRSSRTAIVSLKKLLEDNFVDTTERPSSNDHLLQRYDPAFILRFSIHCLLMGYIEAIEFSRLGLLAITFVSISSPDDDLRKLGYESLGSFKKALQNYRKSKDALQLQLLLTYLQNGITEPWQQIPSMTAIFAAEASFTLLDPSQNHFFTISKLLMRSPKANLMSVPLFHTLFESSSIHFKMDRLWILRLIYAGLNLNCDAKIYMRNKLLELLLSFYASSLSDPESKILILQIIKKSVKLPMLVHYLVKECGLLPWLSTVLLFYGERLGGDHKESSLRAMELVLKVINDVVSWRTIAEWLQECAVEQLSEFSTHLYGVFVNAIKLLKENVSLVNSMLHVLGSTLRLSQKRKIFQPHFTLSLKGLFQLYQAIYSEFNNMVFNLTIELAIDTILMSTPVPVVSHMDRARLSKLLMWAISSVLRSFSDQSYLTKEPDPDMLISYEDHGEESRISKLLRWATASLILGSISNKASAMKTHVSLGSSCKTLQCLLEDVIKEGENEQNNSHANEALAIVILYLQQLLGRNSSGLSSVILALCLLLFPNASNIADKEYLDVNRGQIALLCSKIRCPVEANPSWRWSFYQPWKDLSSEQSEMEQMEEEQACQSLLILFSNALGGRPFCLPVLSPKDVEQSGLFEWEKETFLGSRT
ncbi:uncharacterized protein LOC103720976 isoform X2 [Phoenix dactylifera]|uniref:Uncharacterized protein LOC103720976 isoform X2 n=1 Tax=Phoenix dactylifera TaxID=42345 RepID=A0A8B8ZPB6_PHODC|nr:uncharacterized protein LOC103720976 isoform X2 [Phoenix dactylifera]